MSGPVQVDRSGPVWHVTLDRPQQGNACSAELVAVVDETLRQAERDRAQALVLRGAGRHFCLGFDLSAIGTETDDSLLARFVRIELMLQRLARAPFPTVAVAHGHTVGAGADIFAACTVRLAEGNASFSFPGARGFGLVLGTRRLCDIVGRGAGLRWIESACTVDAQEALAAGLVARVVEPGTDVGEVIRERLHDGASLGAALRRAASPQRAVEDASDLQQLVESAAAPGLRDRIAAYVERVAARRAAASAS